MAKIIVVAACKGGAGKSTIAAALAAHIASLGQQVNLVDADPQQSLGLWYERRGWPSNPNCFSASEDHDISRVIDRARAGADWVIIDLPGSLMRTDIAIRHADLIIIPVRPSMLDLEAVNPICEVADEAGVPRVFIVNAADKDWKLLGSAIDALAEFGTVLSETIRYHEGHPAAMAMGQTAAELKSPSSRVAKAEIAALWLALSKRTVARKVRA